MFKKYLRTTELKNKLGKYNFWKILFCWEQPQNRKVKSHPTVEVRWKELSEVIRERIVAAFRFQGESKRITEESGKQPFYCLKPSLEVEECVAPCPDVTNQGHSTQSQVLKEVSKNPWDVVTWPAAGSCNRWCESSLQRAWGLQLVPAVASVATCYLLN